MRKSLLAVAIAAAMSLCVASAHAQLLYSFETGDPGGPRDGFLPDNGVTSTAQATYGTTVGSNSLEVVTPGGYTGTYTQSDLPAALSDPNYVGVTADVSISPNAPYGGNYSDVTLTMFAYNNSEGIGASFTPLNTEWANVDFAPGTYLDVSIPFTDYGSYTDPTTSVTYPTYGALINSGTGWAVSGFQFTFDSDAPATVYFDNVNAVVPEPASIGIGAVSGLLLLARRRKA
jgi:hypothetical protein